MSVATSPDGAAGSPETGPRPIALLPMVQLLRISAFWLGLTAIDTAYGLFIQFRLNYSDLKGDVGVGVATAIISIGGAIVAIAVQPTVGSISDYTISRWGRRKPFIVFGALLDVVFLLGIAWSNSLVALTAFVILLNFSTNVARGPFQGYVPDLVAESQVGMASAMVGLMQIAGNVTGFLLASVASMLGYLPLALIAVAVVELVTMVSVVMGVGRGLPPRPRAGKSWVAVAKETWATDILAQRSYVWLVASRLFFLMAGGILYAFAVTYLKRVFDYTEAESGLAFIFLIMAVVVGSAIAIIPASRVSDRIGRKKVIWAASFFGAVGVGITALAPTVPIGILGAAVYGTAAGTFMAVDWALMTDIIPRASAGRYMGLSNVATGSSGLLAGVVGGLVLDWVTNGAVGPSSPNWAAGPRASFLVAVALYVVAALLLVPVVEPHRKKQPEKEPLPA
jgi:MFS family permease